MGSDPTTVYLSELTAAAERIDPVADEGDDPVPEAEASRRDIAAAHGTTAWASAPVFIPAPVLKPEFIPAPAFKPEFIPATEFRSGDT
ncbi:MAG: hypothetical protein NUW01_06380 [Gemmatimonadaceae bacterium]|nr:hypothetical protein [Gemmatimonadaceae bacterium]